MSYFLVQATWLGVPEPCGLQQAISWPQQITGRRLGSCRGHPALGVDVTGTSGLGRESMLPVAANNHLRTGADKGESDCLVETKHCDDLGRCCCIVSSAQCSECKRDDMQTSAGKQRE